MLIGIAMLKMCLLNKTFSQSNKKSLSIMRSFCRNVVRAGRLELPHLAALDPKSSVSTNSTTPAKGLQI